MSAPIITRDKKSILAWLIICASLIGLMVFIGGYTRLSGSGLSITQWKPIHGTIPPLNESAWQEEFEAYKNSPQYKLVNSDMTIEGFKTIFWPEYIHRLLGRIIGIAFFFPLIVFAMRKSISKSFFWRMAGILALGGLQGAIGWIMVKSGLVDSPHVSHIKLTLHLSIAFLIFALILWIALRITNGKSSPQHLNNTIKYYRLWFFLLSVQIVFGGFMAGLHGGLIYNTWPDMNGEFIPAGLITDNLLDNITFVQFTHRNLAVFLALSFLLWCISYRDYIKANRLKKACMLVGCTIFIQFALGVITLINQAPLGFALAHQSVALILWAAAIWLLYKVNYYNNKTEYIKLVK